MINAYADATNLRVRLGLAFSKTLEASSGIVARVGQPHQWTDRSYEAAKASHGQGQPTMMT